MWLSHRRQVSSFGSDCGKCSRHSCRSFQITSLSCSWCSWSGSFSIISCSFRRCSFVTLLGSNCNDAHTNYCRNTARYCTQKVPEPVKISQLHRVKVIKILGVTITNGLSVSPHVQSVIASCAQVLYALCDLRTHGLCDSALHTIYRSVVVAKLLYASSAWEGFANATNRNKIQSFINKSKRNGYSSPDLPDFNNLCTSMKVSLFNSFKNPNTCTTSTTTTPRQSYAAIWFTTQSTRQDSTREKLKPCGL